MDDMVVASKFSPAADAVLFQGDCLDFLTGVPDESMQLIVTSPPYNIGKSYEQKTICRAISSFCRMGGA